MRAVLMEKGKLWVDDIDSPKPGKGEVLVATKACGICGSDLHAAKHTTDFVQTSIETGGAFKLTTFDPVVLGHEFCAEIVDYGPETDKTHATGQLVCSIPVRLQSDNNHLAVGYSTETPGGFAEQMVLSERMLLPVPAGTPATAAALTEPLAVGYHAVMKAQLQGDEAILVLGCGPVGLAVITALKAQNVAPIVAADFSSGRREYATTQGADWICNPAVEDPFQVSELRKRKLVVFECVGVPGVLDDIFTKAPHNTRIVVVGVCLQTDHMRPLVAINKELSLQFVLGYTPKEFTQSLHAIADGTFDVGGLVSHEVGLDEVADTFVALADPERYAKVIVNPSI
ncbi:MAG: alcohol dehydrogenase catalytic domain-containing protein [Pseudomonadales bacterium]|nr:alcohol dehydrogenase catalytic domain-containing protein [Pseudomonadales bacterium]